MDWKIINTEKEYEKALARFEELFDAGPGTPESDEADLLALLIENYDKQHNPVPEPDPVEAIKFCMEQMNLKPKDLVGIIGDKASVSKVLTKKRKLNLNMIRSLHSKLNIPYETLMASY